MVFESRPYSPSLLTAFKIDAQKTLGDAKTPSTLMMWSCETGLSEARIWPS